MNDAVVKKVSGKMKNATKFFTADDAAKMGEQVVITMKEMISKGISPIREVGRFPAYKHQRVKGKYPANQKNNYPDKKQRPVNLTLSGEFLSALSYRVLIGKKKGLWPVEIGYLKTPTIIDRLFRGKVSASKKEEGHREGVNGQPKRPTIPQGDEQFAAKIQKIIFGAYRESYKRYVNK